MSEVVASCGWELAKLLECDEEVVDYQWARAACRVIIVGSCLDEPVRG